MKYINKLNIDFDNWGDIPNINEQQIKKLHPEFYNFLIKRNLLGMYLEIFDKCYWKYKGDTFEEIMNYYNNNIHFFYNITNYTLNYQCVYNYNIKYYNIIINLDSEFGECYSYSNI